MFGVLLCSCGHGCIHGIETGMPFGEHPAVNLMMTAIGAVAVLVLRSVNWGEGELQEAARVLHGIIPPSASWRGGSRVV